MAVGNIDSVPIFAASGNFFEAEGRFVKIRELCRVLGENSDMSNPWLVDEP